MIIRINLHPDKKPKAKANPAGKILVVAILLAIAIVGGFYYQASAIDAQTRETKSEITKIQKQVDEIKKRVADVASIKKTIEELRTREMVLAQLTSIRQGPQFVLNELSRILTNPRDIVARRKATEQGWLLAWEPDNIMLKSFKDIGNSNIQIEGQARTMDDVKEFWTRFKSSPMFRNVKLIQITQGRDSSIGENTQNFIFTANANFNYQTNEGLEVVKMLTAEDDEGKAANPAGAAENNGE
jgi:Tfp pilus assembly protein PilN